MAAIDSLSGPGVPMPALDARQNSLIQSGRIPTDASKIDKAAKEFEAVLLGSWLQQAENSFATIPGGDEEQDVGHDQRMSMGVQSLATSIAASGGLGIGRMIASAMHRIADKSEIAAQTAVAVDSGTGSLAEEQK